MKIEFQTPKNGRKQTAIVTDEDGRNIELDASLATDLFVENSFGKSWDEIVDEILQDYPDLWERVSKV